MILKKCSVNNKEMATIDDVPLDIISDNISSYLTIYENYQLLYVFKDLRINWEYLQLRDYPSCGMPLTKYNAIHLDNGNIVSFVQSYFNEEERQNRPFITKSNVIKYFGLRNYLSHLQNTIIKRNPYRITTSKMYLFDIREVQQVAADVYFGLTNMNIYLRRLEIKRECNKQRRIEEEESFQFWKYSCIRLYEYLTIEERREMIDNEFKNSGRDIRRGMGDKLCDDFIMGYSNRGVSEIVAMCYMAKLFFNNMNSFVQHKYTELLLKEKFRNQKVSWYDCVDRLYKKKYNEIQKIRTNYEYIFDRYFISDDE